MHIEKCTSNVQLSEFSHAEHVCNQQWNQETALVEHLRKPLRLFSDFYPLLVLLRFWLLTA